MSYKILIIDDKEHTMSKKILVIDDEKHLLKMLEMELKFEEYKVMTALDGDRGLGLVREFRPDLIVTDCMMPNITGIDVLEKLREDPSSRDIPVILLSNKWDIEDTLQSFSKVMFMRKPFEMAELCDNIKLMLEASESGGTS